MNTHVRDMYINVLEKRAAEAAVLGTDSQEVANKEVASNNSDQRAQLSGLLSTSAAAQKDTKQIGKLLPIAKKTPDTTSSNPMLKVAMHEAFFDGVRRTEMFKTSSNEYLRTAFRGFEDEMGKMAMAKALGSVVAKLPSKAKTLTRHGTPTPQKAALTLAEEARFAKAPKQVGSGVWKLARANAVAKFAASFTPTSAIRARQEHENQPENVDPGQTSFRSTAR